MVNVTSYTVLSGEYWHSKKPVVDSICRYWVHKGAISCAVVNDNRTKSAVA